VATAGGGGGGAVASSSSSSAAAGLVTAGDRARTAAGSSGVGAAATGNQPLNAILLQSVFGHSAASLREVLQTQPLLSSIAFKLRWVTEESVSITFDGGIPPQLVQIRAALRDLCAQTGLAAGALLCVISATDGTVLRTEESTVAVGPSTAGSGALGQASTGPRLVASSMSRTASGSGVERSGSGAATPVSHAGGQAPKKLGGWAAIASGAASTQPTRSTGGSTSVWESGARRNLGGGGGTGGGASGSSSAATMTGIGASAPGSRLVLSVSSGGGSARASPRPDLALPGFSSTNDREATPDDWENY